MAAGVSQDNDRLARDLEQESITGGFDVPRQAGDERRLLEQNATLGPPARGIRVQVCGQAQDLGCEISGAARREMSNQPTPGRVR